MADSISIVMKMIDDLTPTIKSISSSSQGCSKQFEELQRQANQLGQRYTALNKSSAEAARKALDLKKQMDDARKAFKKTQSEADGVRFQKLKEEYEDATAAAKGYSNAAKETIKDIRGLETEARKIQTSSGKGGFLSSLFGSDLGGRLGQAGVWKMLGDSLSTLGGTLVESAIGQPLATLGISVISGAMSGLAAGQIAGVPLIGAAIGTASGAITGISKMAENADDAYKDYYKGLNEMVSQATDEGLTRGKALAASRETDKLAFSSLLGGEEKADNFLKKLNQMADTTPFQYDDLTGLSQTLLTFGYAVDDILPTLTKVGDAGASKGLSTAEIGTVATYIGRMKSSGKASLEYLNPLMERGFGVFEWIAEDLGISQKAVYDKISKGDLSGTYVSDLILKRFGSDEYAGQMEAMSKTTEGLDSTLEGALNNIEAAGGEVYNTLRNEGKKLDIAAYGGELGEAMKELGKVTGENRAYGENLSAQYTREALETVLLGNETTLDFGKSANELAALAEEFAAAKKIYDSATSSEDEKREAGLKMERIKESTDALATAAYESSEWYQKVLDEELKQIDAIRDNTKWLEATTNELQIANAYSKGHLGFDLTQPADMEELGAGLSETQAEVLGPILGYSSAYGLRRVPFNGYPIIAHQDERLLTAAEAREQDRGGRNHLTVNFTGPITVRQDSDLDEIASRLADEIDKAQQRAG